MTIPEDVLLELVEYGKALAQYFYMKQYCRYPLEEYISATHLGIAEALDSYTLDKGEIVSYVKMRMQSRVLKVVKLENKLGNKVKLLLHPHMSNTGYLRWYLREIYTHVYTHFSTRDVTYFNTWLYNGGVYTSTQNVIVHKIRKSIREFDSSV
jgi:hypothetical protein